MGLIHDYEAIPAHFKEQQELLPVLKEVATDLYTGTEFPYFRTPRTLSPKKRSPVLMETLLFLVSSSRI